MGTLAVDGIGIAAQRQYLCGEAGVVAAPGAHCIEKSLSQIVGIDAGGFQTLAHALPVLRAGGGFGFLTGCQQVAGCFRACHIGGTLSLGIPVMQTRFLDEQVVQVLQRPHAGSIHERCVARFVGLVQAAAVVYFIHLAAQLDEMLGIRRTEFLHGAYHVVLACEQTGREPSQQCKEEGGKHHTVLSGETQLHALLIIATPPARVNRKNR